MQAHIQTHVSVAWEFFSKSPTPPGAAQATPFVLLRGISNKQLRGISNKQTNVLSLSGRVELIGSTICGWELFFASPLR